MLHFKDENVRKSLLSGSFGLERESLRILPDGHFSHRPHPFDDEHITRDFCENQLEINTPVTDSAEEAVSVLLEYTEKVKRKLAVLPGPELLWPFSNPPYIRNEEDIPIAVFKGEDAWKTEYRKYLSKVYGRYLMTFSGIHVNYSFSKELLEADFALSGYTDFKEYKDDLYLAVTRGATHYGWIITILTAASPVMDSSYGTHGAEGGTVFSGMASVRCGENGYWNYFTPYFSYESIEKYVGSIQKYVDHGLISAASELYFPVRLKPPGAYTLERLKEYRADHIELRMVDLNPYEPSGINIKDLKFSQLFIVWLACTRHEKREIKDQIFDVRNFKNAARCDLERVNYLKCGGAAKTLADAAKELLAEMKEFYSSFGKEVNEVLDFEIEKLTDPEKSYARRVKRDFGTDFVRKGLEWLYS